MFTNPGPNGIGYIIKLVQSVAITQGTPVSIWKPSSGKKFHIYGYLLAASASNISILFEDGTGNEVFRLPGALTNNITPVSHTIGDYGYLSTTANNQLFLDVTSSMTVNGYVYGFEE